MTTAPNQQVRAAIEVLMNFNADLIRRGGGQYAKGQLDLGGVASADKVCGGDWWRGLAVEAHMASGGKDWETSAEAVALEYARRLARGTDKGFVVAPVRRQPHHQPVYFLVFVTADPHGHWVFGHAASVAREQWLHAIGPDPRPGGDAAATAQLLYVASATSGSRARSSSGCG